MLEISNIDVFYGDSQALTDITLKVNQGEIVTIIGANGAGKTTTLKAISGLLKPRKGSILFKGKNISTTTPGRIVRLGIAHCPEGRQLWPEMTVLENLEMGAFTRNDKDSVQKDIESLMDMFPIIRQRKNQLAQSLSGGEQQALAIARALISKPEVVLFDEPSLGLSPILVKEIINKIKDLRDKQGLTILLVEQNAFAALNIADHGYVYEKGKIVLEDEGKKLLNNSYVKRAYLGTL